MSGNDNTFDATKPLTEYWLLRREYIGDFTFNTKVPKYSYYRRPDGSIYIFDKKTSAETALKNSKGHHKSCPSVVDLEQAKKDDPKLVDLIAIPIADQISKDIKDNIKDPFYLKEKLKEIESMHKFVAPQDIDKVLKGFKESSELVDKLISAINKFTVAAEKFMVDPRYIKFIEEFLESSKEGGETTEDQWCIARYGPANDVEGDVWAVWTDEEDFQIIKSKERAEDLCKQFQEEEDSCQFRVVALFQAIQMLTLQPTMEEWEEENAHWSIEDLLKEIDIQESGNSGLSES